MHDGVKIIRALIERIREDYEIAETVRIEIVGEDGDIGIAVRALVLMDQAEQVADLVADRAAIPRRGIDGQKLLAADHADVRLAAFEAADLLHRDIIALRRVRD